MARDRPAIPTPAQFQELLGYLNFSSGTPDPTFLANLNQLFAAIAAEHPGAENVWPLAGARLRAELQQLAAGEPAFRDVAQAEGVLRLAIDRFGERYRNFHRDLLYHQSDADLWSSFFVGRVCEALLAQGGPWNEDDRIVDGAIARLNDYIGYRPVAVLRTAQKIEPYEHEWVRPLPLFIRAAGCCAGRHQEVVEQALAILEATDPDVLRQAWFDPQLLDELAIDPRAYDFDHPVNKRPNYHFGQWDPHHLDGQGRYRRFVVQQVTLDVLLSRVDESDELPRDEVLLEAAAVLAGTILMASGTSGDSPEAHDSSTKLTNLLPHIAAYRDQFYEQFIAGLTGDHGDRLRAEAIAGKQPLAAARQHLNQQLARRRAAQLEHVHLAQLFARMGYPEAALRQAQIVPVAAARIRCEIQCRLTTGHKAIDAGEPEQAAKMLFEIEDYLRRGIHCGALPDPWNILGFQGQFSLFPSPESSVPDHRLEQLITLVEQIFSLHARAWSAAAVRDLEALVDEIAARMGRLAQWWDQFASTTIESLEGFSGNDAYDSAREVAAALRAFHEAGAAAGDIGFWRSRVSQFNSPKAYALVVSALLDKPDLMAAQALLMQWLSQAEMVTLEQGEYSFYRLVERWLGALYRNRQDEADPGAQVCRFFDLLEANAEDYWSVPTLELLGGPKDSLEDVALDEFDEFDELDEDDEEDDDEEENLYGAAYDDVVFRDSTADGTDADMLESGPGPVTDFELEHEARRVAERLALLRAVAAMWTTAALSARPQGEVPLPSESLARWLEQASENRARLLELLRSVNQRRVPAPSGSRDSLLEFDRRRVVKEILTDKVATAAIETSEAIAAMRAVLPAESEAAPADVTVGVLRAVVQQDRAEVERLWPDFLAHLKERTLLYTSLNKGGDPARLVEARALQHVLRNLLAWLPKLGLFAQTCQLIEASRLMESANPVGPGAISEYDRLFAAGYEALVDSLVSVSQAWPAERQTDALQTELVECLEQLTESLLKQWLAHSRTLRLSVLERIADDEAFAKLQQFIETYGHDLFTQRFLNLGNLRAILHQGVDSWLDQLVEAEGQGEGAELRLLDELGKSVSRNDAVKHLSLVIEAIAENYSEYRDYNSTTTQSDRGEMLYTLLDFLRLRTGYDRVAWNLKPVVIAHAVLVRRKQTAAAEAWCRALVERTTELADSLEQRGLALQKKYAMRLPTVTDRLAERFVRPLVIDRVRALVRPAIEQAPGGSADGLESPFDLLEQEAEALARAPTGVGHEVPAWLAGLEEEVDEVQHSPVRRKGRAGLLSQVPLSRAEVDEQLTDWEQQR